MDRHTKVEIIALSDIEEGLKSRRVRVNVILTWLTC